MALTTRPHGARGRPVCVELRSLAVPYAVTGRVGELVHPLGADRDLPFVDAKNVLLICAAVGHQRLLLPHDGRVIREDERLAASEPVGVRSGGIGPGSLVLAVVRGRHRKAGPVDEELVEPHADLAHTALGRLGIVPEAHGADGGGLIEENVELILARGRYVVRVRHRMCRATGGAVLTVFGLVVHRERDCQRCEPAAGR
mmetsp:Transcript_16092/g.37491  ORF Transcript_16092/g.37491 Transcript_16092/m.37491 type:complete len:200 (+) Transcript_16092:151-750(+)